MTIANVVYRQVTVRAIPVYQCNSCGAKAEGQLRAYESQMCAISTSDVKEILDSSERNTPNHYMPFHWAGYGKGKHLCPNCKQ